MGRRIMMGGRLGDLKRMPRYAATAILGATLIWAPLLGYLKTAPLAYRSTTSLILPGSGASASMNLNGIGQASSFANSAFASNAVSPTETYKRLLGADRIVDAAAQSLGISREDLGAPRIRLVDQTSLIHVEMTGGSPEDSQARGDALLQAFFLELDALRDDEASTREDSGLQAIDEFRASVAQTRSQITQLQDQSGLMSVDQYDRLVDRHLELEAVILDRSAGLSERRAGVLALETQLGLDAEAASATLKLFADGGYLALLEEAARHEVALADANARFGSRHPRVEDARSARDEAASIAVELAMAVTGMDMQTLSALDLAPQGARAELLSDLVRKQVELSAAEHELATLRIQFTDGQAEIERLSRAASDLQDLERDFSVAEAIFASAIARAETGKSDVYASYPLVQVLENPSLPDRPSSPNRKLAFLAGIAATLMLLFGLSLGWIRLAVISRLMSKPETGA
ncbi:MAG: GumC family protein [Octadecabacter sp.]